MRLYQGDPKGKKVKKTLKTLKPLHTFNNIFPVHVQITFKKRRSTLSIVVRQSSHKSTATHSYQCSPVVFVCVQNGKYGCQCLGFLICAHMHKHAIAHGGCTDTVESLHWKLTLGEKFHAALGTWTHVSIAPGLAVGCSTTWAVPTP